MSSPTSIITIKNKGSVAALVYPALAILAKRKRPKGGKKARKKRGNEANNFYHGHVIVIKGFV